MGGDVFDVMAKPLQDEHPQADRPRLLWRDLLDGVSLGGLSQLRLQERLHLPQLSLDEDYPDIHPRRPKNVTILWQGGHAHYEDWLTIIDPLRSALEKRPNARFLMWGHSSSSAPGGSRGAVRAPLLMPYEKYTLRLATLGHHINLCPIVDDPFNNAKSSIKWMESSPSPPGRDLAANVGPYGETSSTARRVCSTTARRSSSSTSSTSLTMQHSATALPTAPTSTCGQLPCGPHCAQVGGVVPPDPLPEHGMRSIKVVELDPSDASLDSLVAKSHQTSLYVTVTGGSRSRPS